MASLSQQISEAQKKGATNKQISDMINASASPGSKSSGGSVTPSAPQQQPKTDLATELIKQKAQEQGRPLTYAEAYKIRQGVSKVAFDSEARKLNPEQQKRLYGYTTEQINEYLTFGYSQEEVKKAQAQQKAQFNPATTSYLTQTQSGGVDSTTLLYTTPSGKQQSVTFASYQSVAYNPKIEGFTVYSKYTQEAPAGYYEIKPTTGERLYNGKTADEILAGAREKGVNERLVILGSAFTPSNPFFLKTTFLGLSNLAYKVTGGKIGYSAEEVNKKSEEIEKQVLTQVAGESAFKFVIKSPVVQTAVLYPAGGYLAGATIKQAGLLTTIPSVATVVSPIAINVLPKIVPALPYVVPQALAYYESGRAEKLGVKTPEDYFAYYGERAIQYGALSKGMSVGLDYGFPVKFSYVTPQTSSTVIYKGLYYDLGAKGYPLAGKTLTSTGEYKFGFGMPSDIQGFPSAPIKLYGYTGMGTIATNYQELPFKVNLPESPYTPASGIEGALYRQYVGTTYLNPVESQYLNVAYYSALKIYGKSTTVYNEDLFKESSAFRQLKPSEQEFIKSYFGKQSNYEVYGST